MWSGPGVDEDEHLAIAFGSIALCVIVCPNTLVVVGIDIYDVVDVLARMEG